MAKYKNILKYEMEGYHNQLRKMKNTEINITPKSKKKRINI